MKRLALMVAGSALAVVAGAVFVPRALRQIAFFDVRQVELVGLRYSLPGRVLAVALELGPDRNLFDDHGELERRIAALPGVVSARAQRRLPATLRLVVIERLPIAFVPGPGGLVPLDGDARPLPYDPSATGLDLPLVERPDSVLVRTIALVRASDSLLYHDVDLVRRGADGTVILEMGPRQVLVRAFATMFDIQAAEAVRRHLALTGRPYTQLDARYAGWVVVRRGPV